MKKLLIMLLTMLMMVSVVACSSKEDDKEKTDDTTKTTSDSKESEDKNSKDEDKDEETDDKEDEKDDVVAEDGEVIISELSSKTLQEVIDAGYDYAGYAAFGDDIELYLQTDKVDDSIEKAKESIEGKTIAQLREEYDISLGYMGFNDEYTFSFDIGSVSYSFDLENGVEAIKAHEDEDFFDLEEAEELQNDVVLNLEITYVNIYATLDAESIEKLNALDDFDKEIIEDMAEELVLEKVYYTVE